MLAISKLYTATHFGGNRKHPEPKSAVVYVQFIPLALGVIKAWSCLTFLFVLTRILIVQQLIVWAVHLHVSLILSELAIACIHSIRRYYCGYDSVNIM